MKREKKETYREDFIEIVKKKGKVWASPSHAQTHPVQIDYSAILEWQWDDNRKELFAITITGKRAVCSNKMPAFHIYNPPFT